MPKTLGKTKLLAHRLPDTGKRPRVIGSTGKQLGVISKEEALKKAQSEGLTLVEIAPNSEPPVAKIVDFGKFKYAEEKKTKVTKQRG